MAQYFCDTCQTQYDLLVRRAYWVGTKTYCNTCYLTMQADLLKAVKPSRGSAIYVVCDRCKANTLPRDTVQQTNGERLCQTCDALIQQFKGANPSWNPASATKVPWTAQTSKVDDPVPNTTHAIWQPDHCNALMSFDWYNQMYECSVCHYKISTDKWNDILTASIRAAAKTATWSNARSAQQVQADMATATAKNIHAYQQMYQQAQARGGIPANPNRPKNMTPNLQIRIWWDTSVQAYRMASPYNSELVEVLHTVIPYSDRVFDKQTKMWTFVEKYLIPLEKMLVGTMGFQPQIVTRVQVETQQSQQSQTSSAPATRGKAIDVVLVEFMKLLPFDAAKAAYRRAVMELHPDKGGDPRKASSLNEAWSRIEKELYGQ